MQEPAWPRNTELNKRTLQGASEPIVFIQNLLQFAKPAKVGAAIGLPTGVQTAASKPAFSDPAGKENGVIARRAAWA